MKLLRASFVLSLALCPFVACSPGKGSGGQSDGESGSSNGGSAGTTSGTGGDGATTQGGAGGAGATTNGGTSGTGFGGNAGVPPSGGASGSAGISGASGASGATTGGTAGLGGTGGDGVGGSVGGAGDAGAGPGGSSGGPGAYAGTIIVQDNFDAATAAGPPDAAKWRPYMGSDPNPPVVDGAKSHSPPNSARTAGTSSGNGSFLVPVSGFPPTGNAFYVRVWVNFELATSAIMGHVAFIVGAASRDQSMTEVRLGISTPPGINSPMLDLNLQNPAMGGEVTRFSNGFTTGGDPLNVAGFQFAANRWYCVEAFFNGGMHEFRVWIDGTENTSMHVTDFKARPTDPARATWAPTYNFLKIGAQNYSGDIRQVWYDDVFVGTAPVGCQR